MPLLWEKALLGPSMVRLQIAVDRPNGQAKDQLDPRHFLARIAAARKICLTNSGRILTPDNISGGGFCFECWPRFLSLHRPRRRRCQERGARPRILDVEGVGHRAQLRDDCSQHGLDLVQSLRRRCHPSLLLDRQLSQLGVQVVLLISNVPDFRVEVSAESHTGPGHGLPDRPALALLVGFVQVAHPNVLLVDLLVAEQSLIGA
mmetsp:Transcript_33030/g.70873  ORF Transcript_33030/g.70873 Transcript_33030/m.70873 type:complete len:204 (+) Transcript_33030:639-1250(+)